MSKHKWKPPQMVREPEIVPITGVQVGDVIETEVQYQAAIKRPKRYQVDHKSFSSRMSEGILIPWESEMDDYLNRFQQEHKAVLHTATPAAAYSNFLFIWEMPCP